MSRRSPAVRMRGVRAAHFFNAIEDAVLSHKEGSPTRVEREAVLGDNSPVWFKMARQIHWEARRGRRCRPARIRGAKQDGTGKAIVELRPKDLVVAKVVARALHRDVAHLLPGGMIGVRGGVPQQRAMVELAHFVWTHPHLSVVRFDIAECYESIAPEDALEALRGLGVRPWIRQWLKRFYAGETGRFRGLGRGLPFATILALLYLLPIHDFLSARVDKVLWLGDDFVAFVHGEAASKSLATGVDAEINKLDLRASLGAGKRYAGPILGRWEFAGLVFDAGDVSPRQKAVDSLIEKLDNAGSNKKRREVLSGWAGQYAAAFASPEIHELSSDLTARYGDNLPRLSDLVLQAATRARLWRVPESGWLSSPRPSVGLPGGPAVPVAVSPRVIPTLQSNWVAVAPQGVTPQQGTPSPAGAVLDLDSLSPFDLQASPTDVPVIRPGHFIAALARLDIERWVVWAGALRDVLVGKIHRAFGFEHRDDFVRRHLGADPEDLIRFTQLGRLAEQYRRTKGRLPPRRLLTALMRVETPRLWADWLRHVVFDLSGHGWLSVRQAERGIQRALARAHREKALAKSGRRQRRTLTSGRTVGYPSVIEFEGTIGRHFVLTGTEMTSHPCSRLAARRPDAGKGGG